MVKLRTFICGTVMHLYWGYPEGRNYGSIDNILKVMDFLNNSHFALFSSFDIYAKGTKFINGTSYTHRHMHTETKHRCIQIPFYVTLFASFGIHAKDTNFIFGIPQTYTCTDTQTCTHIDTHMYRDIDTQIQIHTHTHVCIHTQTHTLICMWEI